MKKKTKLTGWNWENVGEHAIKRGLPLGSVACPKCGIVKTGIITPECAVCGYQLFKQPKPNYFELAWTWYEDYQPYVFCHEFKTKKEFEKDVKFLFKKYGNDYLKQEKGWASASDWMRFIADKFSELGYERIDTEYDAIKIFGSYIIEKEKHNDETKEFEKFIGPELIKKALAHNKKLRDQQKRDRRDHDKILRKNQALEKSKLKLGKKKR